MVYIRLDIVNKDEYEKSEIYREIKILIPRDSEDLERDFEYLGLDYRNLDIQDTHIKECEIICRDDPAFASSLSDELNLLIDRASDSGYTTPFNDMKEFHKLLNNIETIDRDKLLAILKTERERINNITDVIKFTRNIEKYYLDCNSHSPEEFAKNEIHLGDLYMEDLIPYIDLITLGLDLIDERKAKLTEYGVLCRMDVGMRNSQEEEEFE